MLQMIIRQFSNSKIQIMDVSEIRDTLKVASDYMNNLQSLYCELKNAQHQILTSSQETEHAVDLLFNDLQQALITVLNKRRETLIQETRIIKEKHLQPLAECQKLIQEKINDTQNLINLGEKLVEKNHNKDYDEFNKQSVLLGTLPEVPQLKDVPLLTLECDKNVDKELIDICNSLGHISYIGPVQIGAILENPGGLFIQWQIACDLEEKYEDIKEYHLQMAYGDVTKNKEANYTTCYIGTDNQYVVRDLPINLQFSFRVSCKFDGSTEWSPWSYPQIGITKLEPYNWCQNKDYQLTNSNKMAKPLKNKPSVLYARGPKLKEGHSIEFSFLDVDDGSDAYIGIINANNLDINASNIFKKPLKSLLLQTTGDIYIDSLKKSTKLPKIVAGTKVCFTYELFMGEKIRINVDSQDKRVTYDWNPYENLDENDVYFIAMFNTTKWMVMVE